MDPLSYSRLIRVFVSSRQKELAEERRIIRKTIEQMGLVPILFEDLNPKSRPSEEVYLDGVERSQIYLGIFHCEYASFEGDGLSPTEQEYQLAEKLGRPRLLLTKSCQGGRDPRLAAFLQRVGDGRSGVVYKGFSSQEELSAIVRAAVAETVSERYFDFPHGDYPDFLTESLSLLNEFGWTDREAYGDVQQALQEYGRVLMTGATGVGKSFLALRLSQQLDGIYLPAAGRSVGFGLGFLDSQLRVRSNLPRGSHTSLEDLLFSLDVALQNSRSLLVIDGLDQNPDLAAQLAKLDYYANRLLVTASRSDTVSLSGTHRHRIDGFTRRETAAFLADRFPGDAAITATEAFERSGGNPLYLYYLRRAPDARTSSDLNAFHEDLWDHLSHPAQDVLSLVHLSFRHLNLGDLTNLVGAEVAEVRTRLASLRGVVIEEAGTYRVFHPSFGDYVGGRLSAEGIDRHYHARLADLFRGGSDALAVAHHARSGGLDEPVETFISAVHDASAEGAWSEMRHLADHLLDHPSDGAGQIGNTAASMALGVALTGLGELDEAERHLKRTMQELEQSGTRGPELADAYRQLGWLQRATGKLESARDSLRRSVAAAKLAGSDGQVCASLNTLAQVLLELGDVDGALQEQQVAVTLARELGHPGAIQLSLLTLGNVYREQDRLDEALQLYCESLEVARDSGLSRAEAACTTNIGIILRAKEEYEESWQSYERALAVNRELADRRGQATVYLNMGNVRKDQGLLDEAADLYRRCLQLSEGRFPIEEGLVRRCQGDLALETNEPALAIASYEGALQTFQSVEADRHVAEVRVGLARALAANKDHLGALEQYRAAADVFDRLRSYNDLARALRGAVLAAGLSNSYRVGLDVIEQHLSVLPHSHDDYLELVLNRARLSYLSGDGPTIMSAAKEASRVACLRADDESARLARLWGILGRRTTGEWDEVGDNILLLLEDALAHDDRAWLQRVISLLDCAQLMGPACAFVRPCLDRIWNYLGTSVMQCGEVPPSEDEVRDWQFRLGEPRTLRIRVTDFSRTEVTEFIAERIALRLAVASRELSVLVQELGLSFDQLVDLQVWSLEEHDQFFPAVREFPLSTDLPIAAIVSDQGDPSYRGATLIAHDRILDLGDFGPDPMKGWLWHPAVLGLECVLRISTRADEATVQERARLFWNRYLSFLVK